MATVRKFQFDVEFVAAPIAPPQPEPEPPPPPSFSERELEAARAEAFAAGRESGLAEGARTVERQIAAALGAIGNALAAAQPLHAAAIESCRGQALTLAAAVARKLAPALVRRDAVAAVESVVGEILPQVMDEPRLVIRAGGPIVDGLKERIDALAARSGYHGRVILLGDERLAGADCRIEWADGGAEHDSERLAQEIERTIGRFLHGVGNDDQTAGEGPMNQETQETGNG